MLRFRFPIVIIDEDFRSENTIDDNEFTPGPDLDPAVLNLRKFIEEIRFKNAEIPIYIYGETRTSQHIPNDVLRELHGFIHMFEDTPEFVARHIIREARSYLDGLAPPCSWRTEYY